jgi:hypothetical protein
LLPFELKGKFMNTFSKVAGDVRKNLSTQNNFSRVAKDVKNRVALGAPTTEEHDSDWHRVNSYIADVLKDAHVLYAKLSRLQSDFAGEELGVLENISEQVLELGQNLNQFSRSFYEGELNMIPPETVYGAPDQGSSPQGQGQGQGQGQVESPEAQGTPPPPVFGEFQGEQEQTQELSEG